MFEAEVASDAATIVYNGQTYVTTRDIAAETIAMAKYAIDNNVSFFRHISNSAMTVFVQLGPGCPITATVDGGHAEFMQLVQDYIHSVQRTMRADGAVTPDTL